MTKILVAVVIATMIGIAVANPVARVRSLPGSSGAD